MNVKVRPFEEYKEMIKDMRKEEMIKGLYDLSGNIIEKENKLQRIENYLDRQHDIPIDILVNIKNIIHSEVEDEVI